MSFTDPSPDSQRIIKLENKVQELMALLERCEEEFDDLSMLDCPEYVNPNERLMNDLEKTLRGQ